MKFSYRWIVVCSVAVFGVLGLSACEMSETCDPTVTVCENPDVDGEAGGDTGGEGPQAYHYVLVEDRDNNASGDRPGADIDAIELDKVGGPTVYLSQIHDSDFGGETPSGPNADFNNAIGSPEEQCIGLDPDNWDTDTFVSLGGNGGFFVGSFTNLAEIEEGDDMIIHACNGPASETWEVSVGVGTSITDGNWHQVVRAGVSTVSVTIGPLPLVPAN